MNSAKGFTLVEMMVVVAIIAILAAIAVPAYNDYIEKGQLGDAKQAAVSLKQAFESNRMQRPRDFRTVADYRNEIKRVKGQVSPRITQLYNFTETIVFQNNNSSGAPIGFSLAITPKNSGKKYRATMDMQGNAERCVIKTSKCEKF